jgi:hypothetical protein
MSWLSKISSNWYHGTDSIFDPSDFRNQSESINSTILGPISVTRNGIFLTDNPELAKDYGSNVMNLKADVKNTANLTRNLRLDFVDSLDPWTERDLWLLAKNTLHDWQLFDNEVGARFVQWLKNQGYDSAILTEENDSGVSGKVLVVFDANNIKKASSFLHKKIARPQYGFLGREFSAFRAVDLKRALDVLNNGFAANEFFATDINRAVFYGHFTQEKYPNIIFQCLLDSSRSAIDTNDADSSEGTGTSYDNIQQATFEIYRLVKNYNIQESDIERFIGSQMGMGYDNVDAPSLWIYLNQLTNVPINEIKQSIPAGYYGSLILDNRGVFGVTDEIPEMQLQYSAPVPIENIEKVYIHSSILDAFRYNYPRYPNGNPIGLPDEVSVIPAQVREFAQQIEEQMRQTSDEDLIEELESLLSRLGESMGRYEDETNSASMDGTIYRKLYQGLPLRLDDFQTTGGFVEFMMPQQRMQIILIIKKAISRPDPRQMYLFPMSKYRGWLYKLASDYLYSDPGHVIFTQYRINNYVVVK